MKARIKYNNEIIDVIQVGTKSHLYDLNNVEFLDNPQDYWTRLEHQYAGMAMQGLMSNIKQLTPNMGHSYCDEIVGISVSTAHALVVKIKEKEERKE